MTTLPPRKEIKPERITAWREHTSGDDMRTLAQEASEVLQEDQENLRRLAFRLDSYKRTIGAELGACVAVESLKGLARGQLYIAVAQEEQERHKILEAIFGELPLRYDEGNKKYYGDGTPMVRRHHAAMNYVEFASLVNSRGIVNSRLATVIGRKDVSTERLSRWKGLGVKGNKNAIPEDIAKDVKEAVRKIEAGEIAFDEEIVVPTKKEKIEDDTVVSPKERRESSDGSEIHITGLGGLDLTLATTLNLQKFRLEDAHGHTLIHDGKLHIPPLPLTQEQREAVRRWIAETVARIVIQ